MTTRRGFLPREGLYIDPIVANLRKILHPLFTLTLLYFVQGGEFSSTATRYQKLVQYIAATSTLLWINNYLSAKSRNNWTTDNAWEWKKELVVVTGGSGGIGAGIAQRLAAMGARVVVVDIIPLTYKPGMVKFFLYRYGKRT
jgi:all-trans-retinol dehydrogenase (NAD+)